ncbi:MAG: hypothetical protein ACI959_001298 [Limisphaerales bacterium]|jgi:hypothetical protein
MNTTYYKLLAKAGIFMLLSVSLLIPKESFSQCAAGESEVNIITESAIGFFGSDQFSWALRDQATNALIDTFVCGQFWFGDFVNSVCLDNAGTYVYNAWDRGGDGWTAGGGGYRIDNASTGCEIANGVPNNGINGGFDPFSCLDNELEETLVFDLMDIVGCTDPAALNYDPCATVDGGCIYPLSNDECVAAIPLSVNTDGGCSVTYTGTTFGATGNPIDDPTASGLCGDADPYPADVWFTVDMPSTGIVKLYWLETPGSSMNVDIYTGTCGSLSNSIMTACSNYFQFDTVTINETPGTTVYVRVWDFGSDLFGNIEICATDPFAPGSLCDSSNPPTNPSASLGASSVTLNWDVIPQSVACQVQGRLAGTSPFAKLNIMGLEPTNTIIPFGALSPATTYEWYVRCACEITPLDVTPFSILTSFTTPAPRIGTSPTMLDISLYPVPADRLVILQLESLTDMEVEIQVSNLLGQLVHNEIIPVFVGSNKTEINTSNWIEGVYQIKVPELNMIKQLTVSH